MIRRGVLMLVVALPLVAASADVVDYPPVVPGYRMSFPADEGSHPAFRTEWWYVTGWLDSDAGSPIGFQVTFFRSRPGVDDGNPSRFAARQLLFAHVAVSDPARGRLVRDERAARAGFGLAAASEGGLDVHIDDWSLRAAGAGYRIVIASGAARFDLTLEPTQAPLIHGTDGFSQKSPDPARASYYYSLTHLATSGRVAIDGRERALRGVAWLDHEWASGVLDDTARGWDWAGVNLDDGGSLAVSRVRDASGAQYWAGATWRAATRTTYAPGEIEWTPLRRWRSDRTGIEYPVEWRVRVGERTIRLVPLMDDQENDARGSTGTIYWEGAVRALDDAGRTIGRGYLELTGYGGRVAL